MLSVIMPSVVAPEIILLATPTFKYWTSNVDALLMLILGIKGHDLANCRLLSVLAVQYLADLAELAT
jgi:hypothetical protein